MLMQKHSLMLCVVALALVLSAITAQAQVQQVSLRVDGLACPFCAYGLEKKLTALKGFKDKTYDVKINEGKVQFGWRDDKPLDIKGIETAVDQAGFTLKSIHATMTGKIPKQDDKYGLVLPKSLKQRFILYEPNAVKDPNDPDLHRQEGLAAVFTKERLQDLDDIIKKDLPVRISGPVHLHKAELKEQAIPPALGIDDLAVLEPVPPDSKEAH